MEKQTKIAKKIFRQIRNKKAQALLYIKIYLKLQQLKEYRIGTGANGKQTKKSGVLIPSCPLDGPNTQGVPLTGGIPVLMIK